MSRTNREKKRMLEEIISEGYNPIILVDARCTGVVLPMSWLETEDYLIDDRFVPLLVGLTLPTAISDLSIDVSGWSGTLAFPHKAFHCRVPWEATRQYNTDECFVIWRYPEITPIEKPPKSPSDRRSHLRVIK